MPNGVAVQYVGGLRLQEEKKPNQKNTTKNQKQTKKNHQKTNNDILLWISTANDKFWGGFWQIVIIILIKWWRLPPRV